MTFDPPSRCLLGLEELNLSADHVVLAPTAHLPSSLTRLCISGLDSDELPSQVRTAVGCAAEYTGCQRNRMDPRLAKSAR